MLKKMKKLELLAPAGSEAALHAAVQAGADAVYLGGSQFNARRSADNFSLDELKKQADYCHLYGVDVHAAVNTLVKENELGAFADYICGLSDAGADAFIVQDIGAAELIRKILPDMTLHASTQMTVTSLEGVKYLENMGFSRVVLSRELSESEIEYICSHTKTEIEVFIHGAICMSYSGQCLMSSILGGRSGNRGCCAQPCRLPYAIEENGHKYAEGYLLSPKDLALVNKLGRLREIGVKSLKIEGRLKRAEYVSAVVGIYRKYLDNTVKVSESDMAELKNAFSRSGFTDGYFSGKLGAQMMSHKTPGNISDNKFSDDAKKRAAKDANIRKIPIHITAMLMKNQPPEVTFYDNDNNYATVSGAVNAETAINKPLNKDRFNEQLLKLGNTPFAAEDIYTSIENGITLPVKEINVLRREAVQKLSDMRIKRGEKQKNTFTMPATVQKTYIMPMLTAEVYTAEQARAASELGIQRIYAPDEVAEHIRHGADTEIVVKTQDIFTKEEISCDKVSVSSAAAAAYYEGKELYGDFRLNIFNSLTVKHFGYMKSVTLSPELNIGEIRELIKHTDVNTEVIAYGRLPLMLMKNCPLKAAGNCQKGKNRFSLRDRKNQLFPVICQKACRAALLNSKPIFTADKIDEIIHCGMTGIKLLFTTEDYAECRSIIEMYQKAMSGEKIMKPADNTFTRGHFYRGVL